jgi:hypothetical protein
MASANGETFLETPISPLDVEALRHHTEPSRFALATIAIGVTVGVAVFFSVSSIGPMESLVFAGLMTFLLGFTWLLLQLWRIRLLGAAVEVTRETLPEMQDAIDIVRARLNYTRRTPVYIVDKQTPRVSMTSYFGVKVIIIEGTAVADLMTPETRSELIFLLSTYFGALKAEHARWTPALVLFQALGLLKFLDLFLRPWYRATVFTGDQIAYVCCADLRVSLSVVYRALAGKEIAPRIRLEGFVEQSLRVRRGKILRLAQLFSHQPHPTNRYLNLIAYAAQTRPQEYAALRSTLEPNAITLVESAMPLFPVKKSRPSVAALALVFACLLIFSAAAVGLFDYSSRTTALEEEDSDAMGEFDADTSLEERSDPAESDFEGTPDPAETELDEDDDFSGFRSSAEEALWLSVPTQDCESGRRDVRRYAVSPEEVFAGIVASHELTRLRLRPTSCS